MQQTITIDPATLQAGVQAIIDDLKARLAAKGYPDVEVTMEFGGALRACINMIDFPQSPKFEWAYTLPEAVEKARARIADLPSRPTREDIGRTLGIVEAQP